MLTYHAGPMRKGRLAPDALGRAYERLLLPRTARRSRRVIVSSMFVARELGHALGSDCVAIPPGVDEHAFTPGATRPPSDALLYVGSLSSTTHYKNVPLLLQAVQGEDYPLEQALFLLITVVVLLAILAADIATALLDPRTRTAA